MNIEIKYFISNKWISSAGQTYAGQTGPWYHLYMIWHLDHNVVEDWILNLHLSLQTSKIASGLTVASIDSGSSISTVGVVCKAGPRNESYDNLGNFNKNDVL